MPLRVVLADDNLLVREGVQRLLEAQTGIDLVATLPGPHAYQPSDLAQHAFTGVVMHTPGTQWITATDSNGLTLQSPPITVNVP